MTTIETIFQRFLKTDAGREIEADIRTEMHERRTSLVNERERRIAETEKKTPELLRAKATAKKKHDIALEKFEFASRALNLAGTELSNEGARHYNAVTAIDKELCETADLSIELARQELFSECDRLRKSGLKTWEEATGKTKGRFGDLEFVRRSNRQQLLEAMTTLTVAAEKLEDLKLSAVDDVDAAIAEVTTGLLTLETLVS